jgi:hypothetical protein
MKGFVNNARPERSYRCSFLSRLQNNYVILYTGTLKDVWLNQSWNFHATTTSLENKAKYSDVGPSQQMKLTN